MYVEVFLDWDIVLLLLVFIGGFGVVLVMLVLLVEEFFIFGCLVFMGVIFGEVC